MIAGKTKLNCVSRRKSIESALLDEAIDECVDAVLSGRRDSPQEVCPDAAGSFSRRLFEAVLLGEMDAHLKGISPAEDEVPAVLTEQAGTSSKRYGSTKKKLRTECGPLMLDILRD